MGSAQLSCHDAPIFRLLLKIAVSLTAFNVTFSIFVRLRAANNISSNTATQRILVSFTIFGEPFPVRRGQPYVAIVTGEG